MGKNHQAICPLEAVSPFWLLTLELKVEACILAQTLRDKLRYRSVGKTKEDDNKIVCFYGSKTGLTRIAIAVILLFDRSPKPCRQEAYRYAW